MKLEALFAHRAFRIAVSLSLGVLLALYAHDRVTDPQPRQQRQLEESVVRDSRELLREHLQLAEGSEIVDPVATDRKVGKVYIYPRDGGWQVSGHYRRAGQAQWYPWLLTLNERRELVTLKVSSRDATAVAAAAGDPRIDVTG